MWERCKICDNRYTPEYKLFMKWDEQEGGYICHQCKNSIQEAIREYDYAEENGQSEFYVEGFDVLEDHELGEYKRSFAPDSEE